MSSAKRAKTEGDAVGGDAARVRGPWILYCTGNDGKFREASFVVDAWNERTFGSAAHPSRARLMQMDPDPTEIQGSADEIARSKVVQAWEQIRADVATPFGSEDEATAERPPDDALAAHPERYDFVVTEDVGLGMRCLNGFPGPYCKPMLEAIGPEGLWNLASRYDDKHTTVTCTVASLRARRAETRADGDAPIDAADWSRTPRLFVGTLDGAILGPPRGDVKHGKASWNSVFTPEGKDETFGELQFEEQAAFSHRRKALDAFLDAAMHQLKRDAEETTP